MPHETFYKTLKARLFSDYPSTVSLEKELDLERLVSPFVIEMSRQSFEVAQMFIRAIFTLTRTDKYKELIAVDQEEIFFHPPLNNSVLMAYDFHVTPKGLALIEINTNAAMYLVSDLLSEHHRLSHFTSERPLELLKDSFLREYRLFSQNPDGTPQKVVITDENIRHQKRFVEFLMFQDLFKRWGWNPEIIEFQDLRLDVGSKALLTPSGHKIDLLYNRYCDFYLSRPESKHLREAYLNNWCCFTPNPFEYLLLADKKRMTEIGFKVSKSLFPHNLPLIDWDVIESTLLPTREMSSFESTEEIWKNRKKYVFKPQNQYGGKSVYRGDGMTHSVFERALKENFLLQEFFPAPQPSFVDPSFESNGWKYDLRIYAYRDEIQNMVARLYKGQLTNFAQLYGGFASLVLK
ncbi:MAG: hypothetical protein KDD35_06215 [Bdellovibrionales bacterium]|nr:hypothetical protein [Bdellovibrionales bacterium]